MSTTHAGEEIIAKAGGGSSIPTHPDGQHPAICIDIIDYGMVETTWKGRKKEQHRICLRFFCNEWWEGEEGPAPLWLDKYFTLSLSEKANLRPFLEAWRGKKFNDEELRGFNVAKLLHVPAFLQVSHNRTPEKTYANIDTIMRLPKGMEAPEVPQGYVRVKDRDGNGVAPGVPDDDLPF